MKRRFLFVLTAVLTIAAAAIAGVWIDAKINSEKLSAKDAFSQAIRNGVKTEIDGVPLYTESSIGKRDISWRIRSLEAPPFDGKPEWIKEERRIDSGQEALEYARSILADRKKAGVPDGAQNEKLTEIVHLEKDNLWMFCYWLVGWEGGVSGCVIDGNSGEYLKGWVEE